MPDDADQASGPGTYAISEPAGAERGDPVVHVRKKAAPPLPEQVNLRVLVDSPRRTEEDKPLAPGPLAGVLVEASNLNSGDYQRRVTNPEGEAGFNLRPGTYTVRARVPWRDPVDATVTITGADGEEETADLRLGRHLFDGDPGVQTHEVAGAPDRYDLTLFQYPLGVDDHRREWPVEAVRRAHRRALAHLREALLEEDKRQRWLAKRAELEAHGQDPRDLSAKHWGALSEGPFWGLVESIEGRASWEGAERGYDNEGLAQRRARELAGFLGTADGAEALRAKTREWVGPRRPDALDYPRDRAVHVTTAAPTRDLERVSPPLALSATVLFFVSPDGKVSDDLPRTLPDARGTVSVPYGYYVHLMVVLHEGNGWIHSLRARFDGLDLSSSSLDLEEVRRQERFGGTSREARAALGLYLPRHWGSGTYTPTITLERADGSAEELPAEVAAGLRFTLEVPEPELVLEVEALHPDPAGEALADPAGRSREAPIELRRGYTAQGHAALRVEAEDGTRRAAAPPLAATQLELRLEVLEDQSSGFNSVGASRLTTLASLLGESEAGDVALPRSLTEHPFELRAGPPALLRLQAALVRDGRDEKTRDLYFRVRTEVGRVPPPPGVYILPKIPTSDTDTVVTVIRGVLLKNQVLFGLMGQAAWGGAAIVGIAGAILAPFLVLIRAGKGAFDSERVGQSWGTALAYVDIFYLQLFEEPSLLPAVRTYREGREYGRAKELHASADSRRHFVAGEHLGWEAVDEKWRRGLRDDLAAKMSDLRAELEALSPAELQARLAETPEPVSPRELLDQLWEQLKDQDGLEELLENVRKPAYRPLLSDEIQDF